jgi:hypothetical protein
MRKIPSIVRSRRVWETSVTVCVVGVGYFCSNLKVKCFAMVLGWVSIHEEEFQGIFHWHCQSFEVVVRLSTVGSQVIGVVGRFLALLA